MSNNNLDKKDRTVTESVEINSSQRADFTLEAADSKPLDVAYMTGSRKEIKTNKGGDKK